MGSPGGRATRRPGAPGGGAPPAPPAPAGLCPPRLAGLLPRGRRDGLFHDLRTFPPRAWGIRLWWPHGKSRKVVIALQIEIKAGNHPAHQKISATGRLDVKRRNHDALHRIRSGRTDRRLVLETGRVPTKTSTEITTEKVRALDQDGGRVHRCLRGRVRRPERHRRPCIWAAQG